MSNAARRLLPKKLLRMDKNIIETLQKERQQIDAELRKSRRSIGQHWNVLFAPPKADTNVQQWVNQAERAVAVYDGFMLMYKLFKRFPSFKAKFKRK